MNDAELDASNDRGPLPEMLTTKVKTKRDGTVMNSKQQIC
jgi:hypothetical protein